MTYVNAKDALPRELLAEVQKYAPGAILYVPKKEEKRLHWGQLSGSRELLHSRNRSIVNFYQNGMSIGELMDEFCLSEASIKKIIYAK